MISQPTPHSYWGRLNGQFLRIGIECKKVSSKPSGAFLNGLPRYYCIDRRLHSCLVHGEPHRWQMHWIYAYRVVYYILDQFKVIWGQRFDQDSFQYQDFVIHACPTLQSPCRELEHSHIIGKYHIFSDYKPKI